MRTKPLFIAIEGGDGSGKSTLVQALREKLGDKVVITREPGGSPYAEEIRSLALKHDLAGQADASTMLCLMFAARFDHLKNTIIPALKAGKHVITDRFDASSYAYQIHAQKNPQLEELFWSLRTRLERTPSFYVYADVDVKEGLRRAHHRNSVGDEGNHFDERKVDFHKRLRVGYDKFWMKVSQCMKIDANQKLEKVKEDFLHELDYQGIR